MNALKVSFCAADWKTFDAFAQQLNQHNPKERSLSHSCVARMAIAAMARQTMEDGFPLHFRPTDWEQLRRNLVCTNEGEAESASVIIVADADPGKHLVGNIIRIQAMPSGIEQCVFVKDYIEAPKLNMVDAFGRSFTIPAADDYPLATRAELNAYWLARGLADKQQAN